MKYSIIIGILLGLAYSMIFSGCKIHRIENHCCQDSAFQFEYAGTYIAIPNAFTPNGDGHNDKFAVEINGEIASYKIVIKRKWRKVFETEDPQIQWDGKIDGDDPKEDIYKYFIDVEYLDGKELSYDSYFCLILEPADICPEDAFSCVFPIQIDSTGIINLFIPNGETDFCQ